ncbi:hypothetical protein PHLGIDRAFT_14424 [Phlebiopsis gigantea 11061_1 CR5-6]|uniref:Uncharacterized protein n=1 Tax=Phlebiopsis gigantea (strain 11061_1 CR5-6) TaxID=745531 RepID=A0A0C3PI48_PHLG1|nr:hypothetical protein PHLGIDRAFT_14424 [Phlebiopsis gigantea 11061_1 CR5-6]
MQLTPFILLTFFLAMTGVRALVLDTPGTAVVAGEPLEIAFQEEQGDQLFSIELVNNELHDSFAIANNVAPDQGSINIVMPCVPASHDYVLEAVNITRVSSDFTTHKTLAYSLHRNINIIFATTAKFTVTQDSEC